MITGKIGSACLSNELKCENCKNFSRFRSGVGRFGMCKILQYPKFPHNNKIVFTRYFCDAFKPLDKNTQIF